MVTRLKKRDFGGQPADPFVAVHKAMIFGQKPTQRGGFGHNRRIKFNPTKSLMGLSNRRKNQSLVSDAFGAAEFSNGGTVKSQYLFVGQHETRSPGEPFEQFFVFA